MSSYKTTPKRVTLLISSTNDDWVLDCAEQLTNAGAIVDLVPDVYTATARLALDTDIHRVLLDIRTIDKGEAAFFRVAARYYPAVDVLIPAFPGAAERAAAHGIGIQPTSVEAVTAATELEHALAAPTTDAGAAEVTEDDEVRPPLLTKSTLPSTHTSRVSPTQRESSRDFDDDSPFEGDETAAASIEPLSTDGGLESAPAGPSLHDAVRARMAGDDPRINRRPPQRAAPQRATPQQVAPHDDGVVPTASQPMVQLPSEPGQSSESIPSAKTSLSQDEVNALLNNDEANDVTNDETVESEQPFFDDEQGGVS